MLISGGHSQFLIVKDINEYEQLGTTIDDALGEAARLMTLMNLFQDLKQPLNLNLEYFHEHRHIQSNMGNFTERIACLFRLPTCGHIHRCFSSCEPLYFFLGGNIFHNEFGRSQATVPMDANIDDLLGWHSHNETME